MRQSETGIGRLRRAKRDVVVQMYGRLSFGEERAPISSPSRRVVPLNEPGVRRAGTGVCLSWGENRSRGESMGVAIGCEGAWPWEPPADPGPGVGCAEGAR